MTDVKDRCAIPDIAEFLGIKEVNKIFQILFEVYILKEYNEREENLLPGIYSSNAGGCVHD